MTTASNDDSNGSGLPPTPLTVSKLALAPLTSAQGPLRSGSSEPSKVPDRGTPIGRKFSPPQNARCFDKSTSLNTMSLN